MRLPGQQRELLGDGKAEHARSDRPELTADLLRAAGLRSQVSCCAGPPHMKSTMHALTRPKLLRPAASPARAGVSRVQERRQAQAVRDEFQGAGGQDLAPG